MQRRAGGASDQRQGLAGRSAGGRRASHPVARPSDCRARQQQVAIARLARWLGSTLRGHVPATRGFRVTPRSWRFRSTTCTTSRTCGYSRVSSRSPRRRSRSRSRTAARTGAGRFPTNSAGRRYSNMISVGVSVPLPIARSERQDREVAARLAQRDQARELLRGRAAPAWIRVRAMRIEWQALRERRRELEVGLLPVDATAGRCACSLPTAAAQRACGGARSPARRSRRAHPDSRAGTRRGARVGPAALHLPRARQEAKP